MRFCLLLVCNTDVVRFGTCQLQISENLFKVLSNVLLMDHELEQLSDVAFKKLCWGLAWWCGSSFAIFNTLSSTGSSVFWFGGFLVALLNWYRVGKVWLAVKKAGVNLFVGKRAVIAISAIVIVAGSTFTLGPEYLKVDSPSIGTCWAKKDGNAFSPVACWSSEAVFKTAAYAYSEADCPSFTDWVFPPDQTDKRYFCLVEIE